MRYPWIIAGLLAVAGCGRKEDALPTAPDPNVIRFEQIDRTIQELKRDILLRFAASEKEFGAAASTQRESVADLEKRFQLQAKQTENLRAALQGLETSLQGLKQQTAANAAVTMATEASSSQPVAAEPQAPAPELYPVGVYDVTGQTVVTGSHLTSREIETGETYRDEFGVRAKRTRTELVEVNEYGYQARFCAENLTDEPQDITASAGAQSRDITLPPRGTIKNVSVDSVMGADLTVTAGNVSRRYRVSYP